MSEEEKINQPTDDSQSSIENENISEENIQQLVLNTQHNEANMEVHKHPHHVTHKKKWGEYLLEFLMLFLAVFLGFVAENIRENSSNREIEKTNIESFIKNLKEDSVNMVRCMEVNQKRFKYLDSLVYLKSSKPPDEVYQKRFIYYMLKLGYIDYFVSNESTFQQMESSGTLRLIKHRDVLDSILSYETNYKRVIHQEDLCAKWWTKSIEQVSAIVDFTAIVKLPSNTLWSMTQNDLNNLSLPNISKDALALQSYYNWRVNERISLGYYIQHLGNQLLRVRTLIPYLQKEYHLEK